MTAVELILQSRKLGLKLAREGQYLIVAPSTRCPPEFAEQLRACKPEVLALLDAEARLVGAEKPWRHIARQVVEGEFAGADHSITQSLIVGLRRIEHPLCQEALNRLKDIRSNSTT